MYRREFINQTMEQEEFAEARKKAEKIRTRIVAFLFLKLRETESFLLAQGRGEKFGNFLIEAFIGKFSDSVKVKFQEKVRPESTPLNCNCRTVKFLLDFLSLFCINNESAACLLRFPADPFSRFCLFC